MDIAVSGVAGPRDDNIILVCPTVDQAWLDGYRREHPGESDPRVVTYGAYLLVHRVVYGVRRRPRSPWSAVWSRVTAAMWLDVFREVTVAQRAFRLARLAARDHTRGQRMLLSFERCVPHLVRTRSEPWDAGPDWGGRVPPRFL